MNNKYNTKNIYYKNKDGNIYKLKNACFNNIKYNYGNNNIIKSEGIFPIKDIIISIINDGYK